MFRSAADTLEKNQSKRLSHFCMNWSDFCPRQRRFNNVLLRFYQQSLSLPLSVGKKSEPKRVCKPKQPERVSTKPWIWLCSFPVVPFTAQLLVNCSASLFDQEAIALCHRCNPLLFYFIIFFNILLFKSMMQIHEDCLHGSHVLPAGAFVLILTRTGVNLNVELRVVNVVIS